MHLFTPRLCTAFTAGLVALLCSSCGFHLPNENTLSSTIPALNVYGSYHHPFYRKVVQKLKAYGVEVNAQGTAQREAPQDPALPTLEIPKPDVQIPLVSVNSRLDAEEYNVIVSVSSTLNIPGHRPLLMRNSLTRSFLNKSGRPLSSNNERDLVIDESYDELASQLVMRLSYLGRQSDPQAEFATPRELLIAQDDPGSFIEVSTLEEATRGMTLLEALQYSDSQEAAAAPKVTLEELNNGAEVLKRSYNLPKTAPRLKDEAPESLRVE